MTPFERITTPGHLLAPAAEFIAEEVIKAGHQPEDIRDVKVTRIGQITVGLRVAITKRAKRSVVRFDLTWPNFLHAARATSL